MSDPPQSKDTTAAAAAAAAADTTTRRANGDHYSYRFTHEEFQAWLLHQLKTDHPALYQEYPHVFEAATAAMAQWRQRFHGDPVLWKRLFDKKSVTKEFVEACPIIDAVQRLVANADMTGSQKPFTIVDLASGKGKVSCYWFL